MITVISFIIGCFLGGCVGITTAAVLLAGKYEEVYQHEEDVYYSGSHADIGTDKDTSKDPGQHG